MEKTPEVKNQLLESIRGIAAFSVVATHFISEVPESALHHNHLVNFFSNWATEAVIIFFILSGIVIHSSFEKNPRTKGKFIFQRIIRLHPTLIISILLSVFVEYYINHHIPDTFTIIANIIPISTLDSSLSKVLWTSNPVIWSLTFEVFFYLFFAIVIINHKKISYKNLLLWFIVSLVCLKLYYIQFNSGFANYLTQVFAFSSIWIIGFYCWRLKDKISVNLPIALFSLLTLPIISRNRFTTDFYDPNKYVLFALSAIPFFIYALRPAQLFQKNRQFWLVIALMLTIYFSSVIWMMTSDEYAQSQFKYLYIGLPFLACLFFIETFKQAFISFFKMLIQPFFVYFGKLSYPIYLLHYPIMVFIFSYFTCSFTLKIVISCCITFLFSYAIESYLQPYINKKAQLLM